MLVPGLGRVVIPDGTYADEVWLNPIYTVHVRRLKAPAAFGPGAMVHLSIKRNDKAPIHDWRDLQRIKNELVGPDAEAVELYPAEERLVDTANQYHLWCFPGFRFPFGFESRLVFDASDGPPPGTTPNIAPGARQRSFERKGKS
jgi:hypothetical protein